MFAFTITKIDVPKVVKVKSNVTLECDIDLKQHTLYWLQWFHNDNVFYRYTPNHRPEMTIFYEPELQFDIDVSFMLCR